MADGRKSLAALRRCIAIGLLMTGMTGMTATTAARAAADTVAASASVAANPLLAEWQTPDHTPPYDRIEARDYLPAFEQAMRDARAKLDAIASDSRAPTFANTIEAMEQATRGLNRVANVFFTVVPSDGTDAIQKIEEQVSPRLARFDSDTYLDPKLFARVQQVHAGRAGAGLTPEQLRLVEVVQRTFLRAGAALDAAGRARVAAIDEQLSRLSVEFGKRILADQKAGAVFLDETEMAGMPAAFQASAAARATQAGHPGRYQVNATRSEFESFLTLARNRAARAKVFRAFDNRGDNGNANDTNGIIRDMVALRLERAKLLGFATHADYVLAESMAKTPAAAMQLLQQVYDAARRTAGSEEADLLKLAAADGITQLEPWDWRYYAEKLRSERYAFDENALKSYLPKEGIFAGLKETTERLFGLKLVERDDISVWADGARTFDVFEADGQRVGLFYADWFARDTKAPGAWMNEIRMANGLNGESAQVVNNANFTRPAAGETAYLSLDEAETMFHEFGHALHGLLSTARYPTLSGTNVYRDFVEFPSQIYEHWATARDILARHARNAKGEPMPAELLDATLRARHFNQGYLTVQQLASALVDMELHQLTEIPADFDPRAFERDTLRQYGVPHAVGMRHRLPHFAHIFNGGYSAGYYAYTWAEVLEADAFAMWDDSGDIWNREIADSYRRNILETGNTRDPADSYKAFRGRMPNADALLKYRGLD